MGKIYISESAKQTQKIGENLAKEWSKKSGESIVLGLEGDLGGGKTTFLQGFARGLGIQEKILSPTFVIMRRFKIKNAGFKNFYHLDCYRLGSARDLSVLEFKKIIKGPGNIIAVEWADIIKKSLPQKTVWVKFIFVNDKKRKILI
jgi:tRNA threonylcarbamoyladenosine biosynthesis protein TsaE